MTTASNRFGECQSLNYSKARSISESARAEELWESWHATRLNMQNIACLLRLNPG